ncbi:MAG: translation initiation factor IF-2, partial [Candidatus Babeliales bacterium]
GKTTLLDFIRKTRVAKKEKGGITQHLAAYEATTKQGNIIFLDTPGHEAFSKIRQRGSKVADIAVIVVAADDGVMPQTIEAIEHAKTMELPIIVAINKIDKVDESRIEVIKRELAQHGVLPEEWGGSAICIPVSAKLGQGVDQLLDMIILQAQIMELRASWTGSGKGYVLEAKFEKGRGPVATVICQHGILKIGDYFKCGQTGGKVNSLIDSYGKSVKKVGPSIPVQVAGFVNLPEVGDYFEAIKKEEYLQLKIGRGARKLESRQLINQEAINLLLKTDTNSSKEAVLDSLNKLSKKSEKKLNIVFSGVGDINESDVEFAFNTGSSIIGLHIKAEANALSLAKRRNVSIFLFDIIYKLLEELEKQAKKEPKIKIVSTKIGEAIVLRVFDIKGVGVIAGTYVKEGRFSRDGKVIAWRGKEKVGEGKIVSLQREKKAVKEVHAGYECGFRVDGFNGWQIDDRVECYLDLPQKN